MNAKSSAANWPGPRLAGAPGRWTENVLSLLLGAGFTVMLFAGIAWYERATRRPPPPPPGDLEIAAMPLTPPPPPPVQPTEGEADPTPMAGFELAPSESAVKVAVSPPELEPLRPQDLSKAPTATLELRLPASFRPRASLQVDAQHIYQRFEVDKVATVLVENPPQVPSRLFEGASALRVVVIWVVETDGTTSNARVAQSSGKPEVDALMLDMVREMVFSPAMKGGRKVRQMTQQQITVKWSAGSPFH